jgi:hypothetical protein
VNARDYLGSTVLHDAAVHRSSAALLCSLLKAGADAAAVNAYASAAADVAEANQRFEAAALLRQAESNQSVNFKLQQRAPMLPMHLLLHSRMPGWRRSSADMTDRSAVFGCLSGMALFDTELDKTELLQRVEFELYSTATDRAVYGDLDTVQQRAEPVCRAVSTQMRQRAAAAAVVESKGEAVVRADSGSAAAVSAQQLHDDSAEQQVQIAAVSQTVSDHLAADHLASDAASGSSSTDIDAAAVQSVVFEQQLQQEQRAVAAAVTLDQSAAAEAMATGQ